MWNIFYIILSIPYNNVTDLKNVMQFNNSLITSANTENLVSFTRLVRLSLVQETASSILEMSKVDDLKATLPQLFAISSNLSAWKKFNFFHRFAKLQRV